MAKAISDEELQLKKRARRRLVGAVALVLVVVVFLPMFLDSEPRPLNQDIAITIPPIPNPEAVQPAAPAQEPGARTPTTLPGLPPPPQTEPTPPTSDAPVPDPSATPAAPAPEAETKPLPRPEPEKAAAKSLPRETKAVATAATDGYVVQLGAFSNAANAKALQKKLQENKFKAYTELIKSPGGDRTRVRVGPYPSKDAADKARVQLKSRKLIIGDATVVRQGD